MIKKLTFQFPEAKDHFRWILQFFVSVFDYIAQYHFRFLFILDFKKKWALSVFNEAKSITKNASNA